MWHSCVWLHTIFQVYICSLFCYYFLHKFLSLRWWATCYSLNSLLYGPFRSYALKFATVRVGDRIVWRRGPILSPKRSAIFLIRTVQKILNVIEFRRRTKRRQNPIYSYGLIQCLEVWAQYNDAGRFIVLPLSFKVVCTNWIKRDQSYAYWTVHHLDIWIKVDQLDDTCFIIYCSTCFRR